MKRLAILLLLASTAYADDAASQAAAGKKAFAEGKYAEAIAAFRAANALQPDPKLLYAIAQAQRMAGDCAAAIITYEEFIKTNADAKLVEFSQANIERCNKELLAKPPESTPAPVPPPEPKPEPVKPPPKPPSIARTDRPWTRDWVGHGLVVGGLAAGAVGFVVWSGARSDAKALNDATDHQAFLDAQGAADGALAKQRLGLGLAIVGVGAIAGGIVHYKLSGKREVMVAGTPHPHGGALTAKVRF